jgi:hypothetical protein
MNSAEASQSAQRGAVPDHTIARLGCGYELRP